jgi:hypothetical protein
MTNEVVDIGVYNREKKKEIDLELILKILNHFPMMKSKRVGVQILL